MSKSKNRADYIQVIRSFPTNLEVLIADLTDDQLTTPYLADEWTVAQNVHHLVDSHMNSYIRLKLILTEDCPPLKPYDQNIWATFPDATPADLTDSLAMLRGLHNRWIIVWESLIDDQWERVGLHGVTGEVTPDDLLQSYAEHCDSHIDQIQRTLAAQP